MYGTLWSSIKRKCFLNWQVRSLYGVKTIRLQTNHSRFPVLQQSKCITCLYKYILTHLYFPQNVTDALVIFPQPTPRFFHAFIKSLQTSFHLHHQNPSHITVPPLLHPENFTTGCWPAVDWKENASPATTRRHKQLVINTGPSPRSSGAAIPKVFSLVWIPEKLKNMAIWGIEFLNFRGDEVSNSLITLKMSCHPGGWGWYPGWGIVYPMHYPLIPGSVGQKLREAKGPLKKSKRIPFHLCRLVDRDSQAIFSFDQR